MHKPGRIVIAEDESLVAEMITGMLAELGHTVVGWAVDGVEAIKMTQQLQPTAVLMDIKMPDMDGLEAARRIADSCPTPVVVLTAYETQEMIEQASAARVGAYLTKPPNGQDMQRALTIAVARFTDMQELRRLNDELQAALETVNTLSGLLPICSHCKKIRDGKDQWYPLEVYISQHSKAEFSHGVCPACVQAHYPEFTDDAG